MLLLICASLQPQATPCWLPGSLHEPRSQATSSDMRNLAHQPRRFCLVLGLAPLRLLLLVPVSVLFGSSSPETFKFEEGGGRPNYKMCWWSAKRKAKFCYFAVVSNDSNSLSTSTLQTQYTSLIRSTIRFEQFTNICFHCHCNCHPFKEKKRDSGTSSVTHSEDLLCFVSAVSDFKLILRSRRLDSLYCSENPRSKTCIPIL